ncbi:glycosyltransferase [Paenibacillus piscarius]|uniref:glycosyltransferase n=1 Tax=Paenibacillus piscarius TaxID=1089681 RepID=UPI001EE8E44D|nr:glycosyltransferase [Paenibacillus piscarius]
MKQLPYIPAGGKARIVFFVKPGLDNFLNPIIMALSEHFVTKKLIVSTHEQIGPGMEEADICWFEWCDDLVMAGSKHPLAQQRILICRLHSFEAFSRNIYRVNWNAIDRLIFVGSHIRDYVLGRRTRLRQEQTVVIAGGLELEKYNFSEREKGFNIAYVGYINFKKGPMLLLHAFKAIHDEDSRYQLHIAGVHQEIRFQLYFNQMIEVLELQDSIHFDGWQGDLDHYLEDKQYVLVTSPLESQHISVMEAMAKGIKPLIHNFYGAEEVFDKDFIWNSIGDLVQLVTEDRYDSARYRSFIEERYAFRQQTGQIQELLEELLAESRALVPESLAAVPKITVGIINYNYSQYLDECLQSVIGQTHPNIEILIVDDGSTDNSLTVIERYVECYDNIKLISDGGHTGLPDRAFQQIYAAAEGEFTLLLSSDDYLPHDRVLDCYLQAFQETNGPDIDYVYGDIQLVGTSGEPAGQWNYREYSDNNIVRLVFERWGSGVVPMIGMFRTSFYQKNDWYIDPLKKIAGDTLNCIINCKRGWVRKHVKAPLLCYRRHSSSISTHIDKRIQSLIYILDYIIHHFDEKLYFPAFNWDQYGEQARQAVKNYAIGNHYAKMALNYMSNSFTRKYNAEQKKAYIQPILVKMDEYFELSLQAGDDYSEEIASRSDSFRGWPRSSS